MNAFEEKRGRPALVVGLLVVAAAFLLGYMIVPMLTAQSRAPEQLRVVEAGVSPSVAKSGEALSLSVKVANDLGREVNFEVLLVIGGELEKYVNITGFNVEKVGHGSWRWCFGAIPSASEVKHTVKVVFSIPSGIAEVKYKVHAEFLADGRSVGGRDFVVTILN
ncbi:MAG: hypothetical protein QXW94_06070 [Desulfurococcaceae archaeon]